MNTAYVKNLKTGLLEEKSQKSRCGRPRREEYYDETEYKDIHRFFDEVLLRFPWILDYMVDLMNEDEEWDYS